MSDVLKALGHWQLDMKGLLRRMYRAPTPRERERWHAVWLLARGSSAAEVAADLGRDAHTLGDWLRAFCQKGPTGLAFDQTGGPPPPSAQRKGRN